MVEKVVIIYPTDLMHVSTNDEIMRIIDMFVTSGFLPRKFNALRFGLVQSNIEDGTPDLTEESLKTLDELRVRLKEAGEGRSYLLGAEGIPDRAKALFTLPKDEYTISLFAIVNNIPKFTEGFNLPNGPHVNICMMLDIANEDVGSDIFAKFELDRLKRNLKMISSVDYDTKLVDEIPF